MQVTINGQLLLSQLAENICENIPGCSLIALNTDGVEVAIPRIHMEKYYEICAQWEKDTKLELEFEQYQKMIMGDVNNYISIFKEKEIDKSTYDSLKKDNPHYLFRETSTKFYYSPVKCKGRFEFTDLALHKNKSFLIIRKAIYNYFVYNIPPEETIKSCTNIFDFCGGVKIKGDWEFYEHKVIDGEYKKEKLQHTIRYFISKTGSKIIKQSKTDNKEIQIEAGPWLQTPFLDYVEKPLEEYNINYDYYIQNAYKEINNFNKVSRQLTLF
jgi:hypothetical protein